MNIEEMVIRVIKDNVGLADGVVTIESTRESLGMDSLDDVTCIMSLEEEFDICILDYEAEKMTSIRKIVDFIRPLVNQKHH